MANSSVINALAKVLIAAAWADGTVSYEEINSLKDLLFQLPEMTASDWAELDIYIETPVGDAERSRLVAELQDALQSPQDKALAVDAVDSLINADGELSDEELAAAEEIKSAIQDVNVGLFGSMSKMLVKRRSNVIANVPNRELYLNDFEKNKIYYKVSRRLELDNSSIDIPDSELRKLSFAGGLMARVAYVDRDIQDSEFEAMEIAIEKNWGIPEVQATLVAEVAASEIGKDLDYYSISRGFFESTTQDERLRFVDVLFAVADGDGGVSHYEIEEIRTIATVLKLSHKQFIDAKLKIPRERRAN
jgi:uncharacterized tellurite resistance protein B-like protein